MSQLNRKMKEYVEHEVHLRFSDFGYDGSLQPTKVCMFFEYARFQIAKDAHLFECFYEIDSEDEVQFPVVEMECEYLKPIYSDMELITKTTLSPSSLPRLDFYQSIVDKNSGELLVYASVKVAIVTQKQGMLLSINENLKDCITSYLQKIKLNNE